LQKSNSLALFQFQRFLTKLLNLFPASHTRSDERLVASETDTRARHSLYVANHRYPRVIGEWQGLWPSYSPFEGGAGGCPQALFLQTLLNPILRVRQDRVRLMLFILTDPRNSKETPSEAISLQLLQRRSILHHQNVNRSESWMTRAERAPLS